MNTWDKRDLYLEANHITYEEYLSSEHWKDLRKRMLSSKMKYVCHICGVDKGLQLHHKTYKRMGMEWLMDVIWLCGDCHKRVHVYDREHRGKWTNLWAASKAVKRQDKIEGKRKARKENNRMPKRQNSKKDKGESAHKSWGRNPGHIKPKWKLRVHSTGTK